MRPVIEKNRFGVRHVVYIIMITICVIAIGFGVYMQFFKDEKLGVILGITKEEEDIELKNLEENFFNIFSNNIDILEAYDGKVTKIKEDMDIIVTAYSKEEQGKNLIRRCEQIIARIWKIPAWVWLTGIILISFFL